MLAELKEAPKEIRDRTSASAAADRREVQSRSVGSSSRQSGFMNVVPVCGCGLLWLSALGGTSV